VIRVAFLGTVLFAATASALPPAELKGFRPGMTLEAVRSLYPAIECRKATDTTSRCQYAQRSNRIADLHTVAGAWVGQVSLDFTPDEKLARAQFGMVPAAYADVLAAITEKYGKPRETQERYQNGFGAIFVGRTATWTLGADVVKLSEFNGSREDMALVVARPALLDAIQRAGVAAAKGRAKDL
jgi:hypothetical protein